MLPSRCQLLDRLIEETGGSTAGQRLTVVSGPTGYGKTSTVLDWLGPDEPGGPFPVRWVHGAELAPEQMWDAVRDAIAPYSEARVRADEPPAAAALRLSAELTVPLTLVIDDYHLVTSPENDMAITDLAGVSTQLTVVVVGRRVTLLDGPLVAAKRRVRLIDAEDLRHTQEETEDLAASLGVPLTDRLREAFARAGGWPLAIRAALNLGSDTLYANESTGRTWIGGPDAEHFDPVANLDAFATASLALLTPQSNSALLAAAQLDAVSIAQLAELLGSESDARVAVRRLLELGFLVEAPFGAVIEYRCHTAVKAPLCDYAVATIPFAERGRLYHGRATEVARTAPFTAFQLECAAEEYGEAEILIARNFTTLTDETAECARVLRTLPEPVLQGHPTLTAALLYLELPVPGVSPSRLNYLTRLWQQGLQLRLPLGSATPPGPIHLPLICQAMVVNRILGQLDTAESLMHHLEGRIGTDDTPAPIFGGGSGGPTREALAVTGSLPIYYREVAATALAVGDLSRARRTLKRLRRNAELKMSRPWNGFPHASVRTVTDAESGSRSLIAALSELSLTDTVDGHMRRAGDLLAELDAHALSSGSTPPGISWIGGEITRAHLAYELGDPSLLDQARTRLSMLGDRLEAWPLLHVAEASAIREMRGPELAVTHLVSGRSDSHGLPAMPGFWRDCLTAFEAMICSSIGDLVSAAQLIESGAPDTPMFRIERARLALFSGNDVEALLIAQSIGDPGATKRQRVDRCLLTSLAAWRCDRREEALSTLANAARLIEQYFLPSALRGLPFDILREVAVAARDAGVCDLLPLVDAIPEVARAQRYEHLTEMELRSLAAIAEHRNANQAAASLFVTGGTVKKHLASVYRKLGVRDRDAAILRASRMGLLGTDAAPRG